MARSTVINDTGMIEHCRFKGAGYMTNFAILSCCNVGRSDFVILAGYIGTTINVAGITPDTCDNGAAVINKSRGKSGDADAMTYSAIFGNGNMSSRHPYGACYIIIPIMARGTITRDTRMIENLGSEGSVRVTDVTILGCWDVGRRLNKISVGNKLAGVTAFTTTANVQVNIAQKYVRCKTAGNGGVNVTLATFTLCRDMVNHLRRCNTGVMAGRTVAVNDRRGMDKSIRESIIAAVDGVARRAVKICLYMTKRLT